jgi:hypothetical protein
MRLLTNRAALQGRHFSSEELSALFEFEPGATAEDVAMRIAQGSEPQHSDLAPGLEQPAAPGGAADVVVVVEEGGAAAGGGRVEQGGAAVGAGAGDVGKGKESQEAPGKSTLFAVTCLPPKDVVLARVLGACLGCVSWVQCQAGSGLASGGCLCVLIVFNCVLEVGIRMRSRVMFYSTILAGR